MLYHLGFHFYYHPTNPTPSFSFPQPTPNISLSLPLVFPTRKTGQLPTTAASKTTPPPPYSPSSYPLSFDILHAPPPGQFF